MSRIEHANKENPSTLRGAIAQGFQDYDLGMDNRLNSVESKVRYVLSQKLGSACIKYAGRHEVLEAIQDFYKDLTGEEMPIAIVVPNRDFEEHG